MAKMGAKHAKMHKIFTDLDQPFDPTKVYEAMGRLVGLSEDAVERGLGKLFREGKLKPKEKRPKGPPHRGGRAPEDGGF